MNSILLTGVNGFLAKFIKETLNGNKKIFGLSRSNSDYNYYLDKSIPDFEIVFDLVIHAAGLAHFVPKNPKDCQLFHEVNVIGTENLLKGLEKSGIPKSFVFISTVAVYGETEGNLITESAELKAKDPYGKSKVFAEQIIQKWCTHNGVICTVLRLPLVVGINPAGNLRTMINGIQNGYYFNIDGGNARKSMVLAEDVAKYILKVAEVGGIYNLTDGYHPNFKELSQLIAKQSGKSRVLNISFILANIVAKVGDLAGKNAAFNTSKLYKITSTLTFDDSKARTTFGWNPTPVLKGFKIN